MTIRRRLTLWYGGILVVSLGVMAGVLYHEWTEQVKRLHEEKREPEPVWEEVGEILLSYGLPTACLLLISGWLLLRKSLSPITALTQAAERIHLDHLKERLPRSGNGDELDRLTEVFNAMTLRLDDSFSRVREFTLHASHELKTPLTVMRAQIESTLRDGHADEAQREFFADQLDEIQRLTKIVDGLTLLAKADAGQLALVRVPLRFDELLQDSLADTQMLARPHQITVEMPVCEEVTLSGDRHRLRQLLLNLTDNAVKYNQPAGRVTLSLCRQNGTAELRITNTGPGVAPEKLPRLFDRFYRGDPAHSNEVDGCGLGLSIAEWIAKAHGGDIRITSDADHLTTVTVRLPVATAP